MPKPLKLCRQPQRRRLHRSCAHSFHSNPCLQNLHSIFPNCSTEDRFTLLSTPPVAFPLPLSKPNAAFRELNCAFLVAGNLYSLRKRVKTISEKCFKLRFGLPEVSTFYGSSCFLMPLYVPFLPFSNFQFAMRGMFINLN